jgi:hypothetical protein
MTSYVSADLRRIVESRARNLCEYCLIHTDDTFFGCQVDHIVSEKHGGLTEAENLCFACTFAIAPKARTLARSRQLPVSTLGFTIHEQTDGAIILR